jgi:hypothetical protein
MRIGTEIHLYERNGSHGMRYDWIAPVKMTSEYDGSDLADGYFLLRAKNYHI